MTGSPPVAAIPSRQHRNAFAAVVRVTNLQLSHRFAGRGNPCGGVEQIDCAGLFCRKGEGAAGIEVVEFLPGDDDGSRRIDVECEVARLQFPGREGAKIVVGPLAGPAPFPFWFIRKTAVDGATQIDGCRLGGGRR